jgi:hypothetical protein
MQLLPQAFPVEQTRQQADLGLLALRCGADVPSSPLPAPPHADAPIASVDVTRASTNQATKTRRPTVLNDVASLGTPMFN